MDIIQALILGIIQGITEFLPVSSSGHLAIIPQLFNWPKQSIEFDMIIHGATLFAVVIYYRKKLYDIVNQLVSRDKDSRMESIVLIRNIVITSIPAITVALVAKDIIEEGSSSLWVISAMLISIGILLVYIDNYFKNTVAVNNISSKNAIIIGLFQSLALVRGVSRSGITIIGGALTGLSKQDAIDYAFLASIPVIGGSFILAILDTLSGGIAENPTVLIVGFVSAFLSGYLAITFLITILKKQSFKVFGYYRIILGIILIIFAILK